LSASMQLRLEEGCARFERGWQAAGSGGLPPRIEEYLGNAAGAERLALLRELLLLDVHYRRRRGENPGANYYAARCPGEATAVRAVFVELPALPRPPPPAAPAPGSSRS